MLPAPPASCAGWWFVQLCRAVLRTRLTQLGSWTVAYPGSGRFVARLGQLGPGLEWVQGELSEAGGQRHCAVCWEWPGDDGMLHTLCAAWQLGESIIRSSEWSHRRRPLPAGTQPPTAVPWPLCVSIDARGWHGQVLERATLQAADTERDYAVTWDAALGQPRLPITELPCTLSTARYGAGPDEITVVLAGLALPWRVDLDRQAWIIWRRLAAAALLDGLGGPDGSCPRHGLNCSWPGSGVIA